MIVHFLAFLLYISIYYVEQAIELPLWFAYILITVNQRNHLDKNQRWFRWPLSSFHATWHFVGREQWHRRTARRNGKGGKRKAQSVKWCLSPVFSLRNGCLCYLGNRCQIRQVESILNVLHVFQTSHFAFPFECGRMGMEKGSACGE